MAKAKFKKPVCLATLDTKDSPFIVKSFNQTLQEASKMKIPKMLFSELIFETDLTIFFASSGVGKTMLAVQIAQSIASGKPLDGFVNESSRQPVLYLDFELSDKQFERRYCEIDANGDWYNHYGFDENIKRVTFNKTYEKSLSVEKIIDSIILHTGLHSSKIIFIDNITWIAQTGLEQSKDASLLMKELVRLKRENNLTIIVLAHTPKKLKWSAMTLNDLAGSSQLGNFCDSVFAINYSKHQSDYRYIKQVKCRFTELKYHSANVIPVQLTNIHSNYVGFQVLPEDEENITEQYHLESKIETKIISADIREELLEKTKELVDDNANISSRELANELGVGKDTALKYKSQVSGIDRQTTLNIKDESI